MSHRDPFLALLSRLESVLEWVRTFVCSEKRFTMAAPASCCLILLTMLAALTAVGAALDGEAREPVPTLVPPYAV